MKRAMLAVIWVAAACGGAQKSATTTTAAATAGGDPVAAGGQVYAKACAKCHGEGGAGTAKAPPVVGADALPLDPRPGAKRNVQFATAADVYTWVKAHMPGDDPGSLSEQDALAVIAFDLQANGAQVPSPLTPEALATVKLH
jgi:alcohol dehydrogenase (cytochrome c)